nr:peptide chain release factor N(5)-glutamine methyltransferase [Microvirga antarctica]
MRGLRARLQAQGLPTAALDARLLLLAALDIDATELAVRAGVVLSEAEANRLAAFTKRRLASEPVARILGEREFWGLPFGLGADTLVPRPDSETVVETALALLPETQAAYRIADIGTGSGCLLVALLHERPAALGIGIDRSEGAVHRARQNAARNGVGSRSLFVVGEWGAALPGGFDLVVSNPPYIATAVVAGLAPEVRDYDPALALDGGIDGLDAYRAILADGHRLLGPDGVLVLEIGFDQEAALRAMAAASGFTLARFASDLAGQPRCIALKRT